MESDQNQNIALRISVLGPIQATAGSGAPIVLRSRRSRAILGMLALAAPRFVPRGQFMDLLWSSRHKEQANDSLRQCVVELHRALRPIAPEMLKIGSGRLALSGDGLWVDAAALGSATAPPPGALDLLRGPLLDELDGLDPAFDRWLAVERQRVIARACTLAQRAVEGQTDSAGRLAAAQQLLRIDRASEAGWRALIASHAEQGDNAAALEAYRQCCTMLAELAHRLPSSETEALIKHISRKPSGVLTLAPSSAERTGLTRSRNNMTRLGIMPLRGLDRARVELVEGLTEEITTALGRFRGLSCILLAHATPTPGDPLAWQALGLDFVLDGGVQSSRDRVRVTVRLLDVHSAGEVVWSQRFDPELTDILALRDEIASQTVAQVESTLISREGYYAAAHRPTDATAYHLLLRAIPAIHSLDRAEFLKAGDLLTTAVARDPDYAPVHAWSAYWHLLLLGQGWAKNSRVTRAHLQELTQRAVLLDPKDARALTLAGHVRAFTGRLEEGLKLHERALSINPYLPLAWLFSGLAHTYSGQHDKAIQSIEKAKKLSPLDPLEFFFEMGMTFSHLLRGDFETAIRLGRRALEFNPRFSSTHKCLLSALGYVGDTEERAEVLARLLALEPGFTVRNALERSPLSLPGDRVRYAEGLRRAGLSE